ncbi:uncharacterized protein LODBEIA_P32380 [Lodderomyces beijingensis]|uniref:Fcf2 pre-rRNA processing C-terminal domain-containing protein n=1 Tax=Lodderomyces beijingensis TaxID=1775926 RepID=A0ABP0ZLI4_9ASCO
MESSETESIASDKHNHHNTTQSPTQTHTHPNPDDGISLDALFADLQRELDTQASSADQGSLPSRVESEDYKSIQRSLNNLPKLTSSLEPNTKSGKPTNKPIRIHDPVASNALKAAKSKDATDARWFHMAQPEITPQIKRDLDVIRQRQALDPKRHYKREKWSVPKFFSMGTIVEGNTGYYNQLKRRERGTSLVSEILADDGTKKYFKRKYGEIQASRTSGKRAHYKKVKSERKRF